jgi:hypothetical protein
MKPNFPTILLVLPLAAGWSSAATVIDFESYGVPGSDVAGQGAPPLLWTINDANDQYSQVANSNVNPTDTFNVSKVLNLGDASAVETPPTGPDVTLSYPLGGSIGATSLVFDFAISDSVNGPFPNRDRFLVSFGNVFSVYFVPVDADPGTPGYQNPVSPGSSLAQWNLFYQIGAAPTVPLNLGVLELSQYRFNLGFSENGLDPSKTDFLLSITSAVPNTLSDGATGIDLDPSDAYGSLNVGWLKMEGNDYGSNSILIDNIIFVPEPSSVLLAGVAGLGLALRRRRG